MKYDIAVSFVFLLSGGQHTVSGFTNSIPVESNDVDIEDMRTKLQSSLHKLNYLTIFTRNSVLIVEQFDCRGTINPSEITLTSEMLKMAIMTTQIIRYED